MPINSGKNLHRPEKIIDDSRRISGTSNGLANSRGDSYWYIDYMDIKPNTQYTFSVKPDTEYEDGVYYHVLDKDYELVLGSDRSPISVGNGHTITTPPSSKYIRYSFQYGLEYSIQFEEGSTATEYEPPAPALAPEDYIFDLRNKKLYVGNQGVDQAYLGSSLFYSSGPPEPEVQIFGEGQTNIGSWIYYGKGITGEIIIANGVTRIGNYAFRNNQITSVTLPDSVTTIGASAFDSNQLTSVVLSNSLTNIESSAFQYNQLTSVVIPDSVTDIGLYAFYDNPLEEVSVGPNTTYGTYSFPSDAVITVREE